MASLTFQPYVDKENSASFGMPPGKSHTGGPVRGLGGKMFGKAGQKQSLAMPRRALGDIINTGVSSNTKTPALKQQKPAMKHQGSQQKKGLQMRENNIIKPSESKSELKVEPKRTTKKSKDYDDIELMHISIDKEDDDYEAMWPKSERISTYITKLITWRPPCLFGQIPVSDDELDEEEEHRKKMEDVDRILDKMPKPSAASIDEIPDIDEAELWALETLEDVPLPSIDDLDAMNDFENKDISLTTLDDSLDIVPSIGSLKLQDTP